MVEQVQIFSRDRKLYSGMSIASVNRDKTKSEEEKTKIIELFNSANTTPDDTLDENEILAYDENRHNKKIRNVLIGAAIVVGACAIGYLAYRGIKNTKNIASETVKAIPESKFPLLTEEEVHERILNGEFGALGFGKDKDVRKIYSAFANKYGLKLEESCGEFVAKDLNGNAIREAHQGFFDGLWYDHHQVFNADNKITNRFVLNCKGKLQSTVEYFYDKAGTATMSVGYGGKAGKDIMVIKGNEHLRLSLQEFIDKFGFTPKYYKEIIA